MSGSPSLRKGEPRFNSQKEQNTARGAPLTDSLSFLVSPLCRRGVASREVFCVKRLTFYIVAGNDCIEKCRWFLIN